MKYFITILAVLLLVGSSALSQVTSATQRDLAVLSAVVQARCSHFTERGNIKMVILSGQAASIREDSFPETFNATAVKSLLSRNEGTHKLPHIKLCKGFKRVSGKKLNSIFKNSWWEGFHKHFPRAGGVYRLSLPGYSEDGGLAIVQVSFVCGGLCGGGFYWILRYTHETWVVVKRSPAWIS